MGKIKVLVSTGSFGKADESSLIKLKEKCEVVMNPYGRQLTTDEFIELSQHVEGVIAGVEKITREALRQRPDIRVISRCGAGIDNVDIKACEDFGVRLYNTPNAPVHSVAELTVSLILAVIKNIVPMNDSLKKGYWKKILGSMLEKKKIGIIGLGKIGSRVAELLSAFDVDIAYSDIAEHTDKYRCMDKSELMSWADIITLHISGSVDECVIGKNELEMMRPSAFIVNTSRGYFIDDKALYIALKEKRIFGAALDVFSEEPYAGELCELDNVLMTPHIGSNTRECRASMEKEAVDNLFTGLGITQ